MDVIWDLTTGERMGALLILPAMAPIWLSSAAAGTGNAQSLHGALIMLLTIGITFGVMMHRNAVAYFHIGRNQPATIGSVVAFAPIVAPSMMMEGPRTGLQPPIHQL